MSNQYSLAYEIELPLLQRAMTSWAKPHRSLTLKTLRFVGVVLVGCVIGGALTLSGILDNVPDHFVTGMLVGFYIGLGLWFVVHRRGIKQLSRDTAELLARQGVTETTISAEKVTMRNCLGISENKWLSFDQVIRMSDATALKSGALVYPIPHAALPKEVSPDGFHADLCRWREAAR